MKRQGKHLLDWQSVITEHGPLVWKTAYRLLNNEADTSDCFQEVFVAAVEISQRENIRNLPALLNRLATHKAISMLRSRMRSAEALSQMDCRECGEVPVDPLEHADDDALAERIRRAIADLPEPEAQAFCLQVINDLSYRQIAAQLNVKTGYVGVLIRRAKDKLQRLFPAAVNEEIGSSIHE